MCPARLVHISEHLGNAHSMHNFEQRAIMTKYARRRVKLLNVACPLCGKVVKYPEKHLLKGHRDLTTRSRSKAVRALEKSVTMVKLQLLWDSKPAVPMAPDFSQAEAPADAAGDEASSLEPVSVDRPAPVWVSPPQVTVAPVGMDEVIDELFTTFDGLAALCSPEDLEAATGMNPPCHHSPNSAADNR
ncbi:unnamed protein product [Leuciscus chuanchicus]